MRSFVGERKESGEKRRERKERKRERQKAAFLKRMAERKREVGGRSLSLKETFVLEHKQQS